MKPLLSLETKMRLLELSPYIFLSFLVFCILVFFYIRAKYGFWAYQPVFHTYDIIYFIWNKGIVRRDLPKPNKYTNFECIRTKEFSKLSPYKQKEITKFIQLNYFREKDNFYNPKRENIEPYFIGFSQPCFLSIFYQDYFLYHQKTNTTSKTKKIAGVITSRPVSISFQNYKENQLVAYYVDYLCVDLMERKKGIAPQLIQTHEFNQCHGNQNVAVSLFKREHEITGIVPLCYYKTFGFSVMKWTKPTSLDASYKVIEANAQNLHTFVDFLKSKATRESFDVMILTEEGNIQSLIKTNNIFITGIFEENEIVSLYFYRKTCVFVDNGMEVLSCFASIQSKNITDELFVQGFKVTYWECANKNKFGYCAVEDISHNGKIMANLREKTYPEVESPTAYYLYNFIINPFDSKRCFILL